MTQRRQWALATRASMYIVSLLDGGEGLVLDHWGAPMPDGSVTPWAEPDRVDHYRLFEDAAPLEYASLGARQFAFCELLVDRGGGSVGAAWMWAPCDGDDVEIIEQDGVTTVAFRFEDESSTLLLTQFVQVSVNHDVVRRWVRLENRSEGTVVLDRVFSAGWSLPVGPAPRLHFLAGGWSREFQPQSMRLPAGTFSMGDRGGVTGLWFSPSLCVESGEIGREREAYGVCLEWSGSWRLQADCDAVTDRLRVSCGVDEDTTRVTLLPGESFTSPASSGVWSADGPDGVSRAWHRYQRGLDPRSSHPERHPIVYNSWFATGFDVNDASQLDLARRAAAVGAEAFVVDDGWFVGRSDDTSGLGDWTADPAAFRDGLGPLARAVTDLGMRFGIWIEPEAVSPNSRLFEDHPNWVYRAANRPLRTMRNQYVLNLGRADVAQWVERTLRGLVDSTPIGYVKWDMNRPVSDGGRPGDPHGRQWSVQHTRNYYRILGSLRDDHPDLIIEGCAAGGGRIDNAVLGLVDNVWPSDETGPRDRLSIQHGFLSAYPPHVMSSWVTDSDGLRDRCEVSFEFRFVVAMSGVLGIGADLRQWDDGQVARARELIAVYRSVRDIVLAGEVYRHGTPADTTYAVEFGGVDGRCCVMVFDRNRDRVHDRARPRIRPQTLRPRTYYRLRGTGTTLSGAEAASVGVPIPFALAADTDVMIFDPVS